MPRKVIDREKIRKLLSEGKTGAEIAQACDVCRETVSRISSQMKAECICKDIETFLKDNWHFRSEMKPKKKHRNFITPYNYPAMWKEEENDTV